MSASVYRLLSQTMTLTSCRGGATFDNQFSSLFRETAPLNLEMNSAWMKRPTLPRRAEKSLIPFSQQAGDGRGWNWKNKTLQHSFLRHLQWEEMVGRMMRNRVPFMLTMYICKGKTSSVDFPPMQQPLQQPCFHTSPLVSPVTREELKMAVSNPVQAINCITTPAQRKLCSQYIQHLCRQEYMGDKRERKLTAGNQDT